MVGVGCSAPVIDEDEIADAAEGMTRGIVLVERVAASDGATQTNVSAKFMRVSASADPELAERVVGSRLDLPAALPGCMIVPSGGADEVAPSLVALGRVVLMDAGDDVSIKTGDEVIPLDRRAFPDVGGAVFGQFYTSRDATSAIPAPAKYVLESSGSAEMDRLAIEAEAPAAPEDVLVAEQLLADGVTLQEGTGAQVHWRSGEAGSRDLVYVDVNSTANGATVRCAFHDVGEGSIPASFLRSEALGSFPAAATVAVHRVRKSSIGAPGIDDGEMRFDLGVVGHATLGATQ